MLAFHYQPARHATPRIAQVLEQIEAAKFDLWLATDHDHAAAARADLVKLKHDLWLAGGDVEDAA